MRARWVFCTVSAPNLSCKERICAHRKCLHKFRMVLSRLIAQIVFAFLYAVLQAQLQRYLHLLARIRHGCSASPRMFLLELPVGSEKRLLRLRIGDLGCSCIVQAHQRCLDQVSIIAL